MKRKKNDKTFNRLFILAVAVILVIVVGIIALLAYIFDLTELLTIYFDNNTLI